MHRVDKVGALDEVLHLFDEFLRWCHLRIAAHAIVDPLILFFLALQVA